MHESSTSAHQSHRVPNLTCHDTLFLFILAALWVRLDGRGDLRPEERGVVRPGVVGREPAILL
jgi:hypothetical protein